MDLVEFSALSRRRQSCRSYSGQPVSRDVLEQIINAALCAPSARNCQPYKLYALTGKTAKQASEFTRLPGMNQFTADCPAFIVVVEDTSGIEKAMLKRFLKMQFVPIDIGLVTAHLVLAATAAGVDTCILGGFREEGLSILLGLGGRDSIKLVIAAGYATENYELRKKDRRKPKPVWFLE
ncbi:MAG: nitroreductase family protein [Firmicutes bacterium]|nr:nitroreductase family protein [Bacillota bacterium]